MNLATIFTAGNISTVLLIIAGGMIYIVHRLQKEDEEWNKKNQHR